MVTARPVWAKETVVFQFNIGLWIVLGLLGGFIAAHKGYQPVIGILVGIIFGPLGLVVAALLPATEEGRRQSELERETQIEIAQSRATKPCPQCGRENAATTPICPRCNLRLT